MPETNINVKVDLALKQEAAALDEYKEMKNNPDKYKRYSSFSEALDEVFGDA